MVSLLLFHLISPDEHSETFRVAAHRRELRKVRENDHALVLMMRTVRATLRVYEGIGDLTGKIGHRRFSDLLSSLSQLVTLPFQSQVCLSKSKANPLGHVICFRPDLVHLPEPEQKTKGACVSLIKEKDVTFAYSRADRNSSHSSSSRRSAARCQTRDPWDIAPSPAWLLQSRWLCRT